MLTVDNVTTYTPVLHNDIIDGRDYLEVRNSRQSPRVHANP